MASGEKRPVNGRKIVLIKGRYCLQALGIKRRIILVVCRIHGESSYEA